MIAKLVTPMVTWANGLDTHLATLPNKPLSAPQEDQTIESDLRGDVAVSDNTTTLQRSYEEPSIMEPLAKCSINIVQQPHGTHKSRGSIHTHNTHILFLVLSS